MQSGVGYKIKLIMPADQSEERRAAMAAFGAELISVPASSDGGGMEAARDLATRMQVCTRKHVFKWSSCTANLSTSAAGKICWTGGAHCFFLTTRCYMRQSYRDAVVHITRSV